MPVAVSDEVLIYFDELRERLSGIEDERIDGERALEAIQRRAENLGRLEQSRDTLLKEYAGAVPEALDALPPEERHGVYRMLRLQTTLTPSGDLEITGDVLSVSNSETAYPPR
jgi:hypothetical protein